MSAESNPTLKTSEAWAKDHPGLVKMKILDYDGWDRSNFDWSWKVELITIEEFNRRLMSCTIGPK